MNNSLKNLFFKYQDFPSFLNHSPITSVHDLGSMGETLLNLAVNSQSKKRCYSINRKWSKCQSTR